MNKKDHGSVVSKLNFNQKSANIILVKVLSWEVKNEVET